LGGRYSSAAAMSFRSAGCRSSRFDISADYTDYADFFRCGPHECLEAIGDRGIPFRPQAAMPVFYKGRRLKASYRADFVCYEKIIVELKALTKVDEIEWAQVLSKRVATKEAS
jgi:hypothetical protein